MKSTRLLIVVAFVLGLVLGFAAGSVVAARRPGTLNDCLLDHVKSGMSRLTLSYVTDACYAKYPQGRPQ